MRRSCLFVPITFMLALALGLAAGIILDRRLIVPAVAQDSIPANASAEFRLMAEAWNTIDGQYVDREAVQPKKLSYGAIAGMVDALGDTGHSTFLTPEMLKEERNMTQGELEGIGAEVQMKDGHVTIVAPMDNSPALRAGLRPGDIITAVDGQDVEGQSLSDVVSRILGPAGTKVTLTILTPSTNESRDVTITRARITLVNVTWHQVPGTQIAHVRMVAFSEGVTDDLKKALAEIKQQNLTGIVLDLRSNPGGLLSEAVSTASQFLSSGNVMLAKDAQGNVRPLPVDKGQDTIQMPMVVLINQGTASAAEIVSGALQDAKRAQLIGETTFGTGTVLREFGLSDGSALLLATEEWLTPAGRVIWHQGIQPDVTVTLPADGTTVVPEAETEMTLEQIRSSGDAQLVKALDVLSGAK